MMSVNPFEVQLDFNNIHDELPQELFDAVVDTIEETSVVCPEFIIGNHFTDNSKMNLADFGFFFSFRNGKTLQSDIEYYMSNFKMGLDPFSRQYISKQRMFILPEYFKNINRNFLINIDYSIDNSYLKHLKASF